MGILNTLLEDGRSDELGLIVVDELHMIEDETRGALLELFLTKCYQISHKQPFLQIIGMSATIPNLPEIADWLKAKVFLIFILIVFFCLFFFFFFFFFFF
jgi:replicative superfamily II helicase